MSFAACEKGTVECPSDYCGTAVVMLPAQVRSLMPPVIQAAADDAVADLIFLKLADLDSTLNTTDPTSFEPQLARSWSFQDSLTLVMRLDGRAQWQDGVGVTAADVAFTFDVYRDPVVASPDAPNLGSISSVTAQDDSTVVIRFTRSYLEQFYDATYYMRILPKHLLDSVPRADLASHSFATHPVGSGPYRLTRWEPGQEMELSADTTFFLGRPGLPRIIWRVSPDPATIISPLIANEADVIEFIPGPENIARIREVDHIRIVPYAASFYGYMAFNFREPGDTTKAHWLFTDRTVRRAIAMALDRRAIVETALGEFGEVAVAPTTSMTRVYRTDVFQVPFDTAAARSSLQDAGWHDTDGDGILDRGGKRLEFDLLVPTSSQARRRSAVVIQSQLRRIGIAVEIIELEFGVHSQRVEQGEFDAYLGSWGIGPSPRGIQNLWTSVGIGGQNFGRYANPRVDDLVARALRAQTPEENNRLWREAFKEMNEDLGAIWLYVPVMTAGVHTRFENVSIRPDEWTSTMWKWRVTPGRWLRRDVIGTS